MSNKEWYRLKGFYYAKTHSPQMAKRVTSRRTAKTIGDATGRKDLTISTVVHDCFIEKYVGNKH
jgi:hypothetical protein